MSNLATSPRYYVVFRGHNPGVYREWAKAAPNVLGVANAIHRRYGSEAEAHHALAQYQAREADFLAAQLNALNIDTDAAAAPPPAPVPAPVPAPAPAP
ncbi:hypothetical protein BV25DRAFT_1922568, partial [Artomyces pyxidatus]